jgi:hypothetical protein
VKPKCEDPRALTEKGTVVEGLRYENPLTIIISGIVLSAAGPGSILLLLKLARDWGPKREKGKAEAEKTRAEAEKTRAEAHKIEAEADEGRARAIPIGSEAEGREAVRRVFLEQVRGGELTLTPEEIEQAVNDLIRPLIGFGPV